MLAYTVADDKGRRRFARRGRQGGAQVALRRRRLRPDERGRAGGLQALAWRLSRRAHRGASKAAGIRVDSRRIASLVARHQGQARSLEASRPEGADRPERGAGQRAQELPALWPARVSGRSLRGVLLRPRLRADGTVLRRRGRRTPATTHDAADDLASSMEAVGGRAAVIVFRACLANTLETAYQLRDAGEFMVASQSIVPIAGIWPWGTFLTSLMPGASSGDVGLALAAATGALPREAREPRPIRRRAVLAHRSRRRERDRRAAESARRRAGDGARRPGTRVRVREQPSKRRGSGSPTTVRARRSGAPRRADVVRQPGGAQGDPVAAPARALGDIVGGRLVRWHHSQKGRHRGIGLYYQPVTPTDIERSHLYVNADGGARTPRTTAARAEQATGWHRIALKPLAFETLARPHVLQVTRRLALLRRLLLLSPVAPRLPLIPPGLSSFGHLSVLRSLTVTPTLGLSSLGITSCSPAVRDRAAVYSDRATHHKQCRRQARVVVRVPAPVIDPVHHVERGDRADALRRQLPRDVRAPVARSTRSTLRGHLEARAGRRPPDCRGSTQSAGPRAQPVTPAGPDRRRSTTPETNRPAA